MKAFELIKKNAIYGHCRHLPKGHMIAVCSLSVCLFLVSLLPSKPASASRNEQQLEIPALLESTKDSGTPLPISIGEVNPAPETPYRQSIQTVKPGDNLSKIFKRAGLNDRHMMNLLNSCKESDKLANLRPGKILEFNFDQNNEISSLRYVNSKLSQLEYFKSDEGYIFNEVARTPDIYTASRDGVIESSLFDAGKKSHLSDNLVMELANIFGWDIDFALDIRKGDTFKVLYEERFLDGEKLGDGNILAAEFINQGETFQALRYVHESGKVSYYTPDGKSMRKAFLRAPLDFRRISSNFNPRRLHPITKTVRPHRGTDYAANRGTPVWSPGAGRVIASSYTKANGNYVVIQHGNNIKTKYLHLHKRYVRKGQKVKQKQTIGTVGSTGYSTAPHLHYEFLISGVHRNPRTVLNKLPKAASIPKAELARFQQQTQPILAELSPASPLIQYATQSAVDADGTPTL